MTTLDSLTRPADTGEAPLKQQASPGGPNIPNTTARTETHAMRPRGFQAWLRYVPLGIAVVVDTVLAVPAFDAVLGSYEILSWLCAASFSVLTVVVAFQGGREAKLGRKALALVLGGASAVLITAVFVLRVTAASIQANAGVSYAGSSSTSSSTSETVLAVIMALVMLAGSAAAWVDGFKTTPSPAAIKYETSENHLSQLEAGKTECQASISRLTDDAAYATYQLDRVDQDLEEALHGLDAAILELQAHARYEIARLLGKPAATSGLDLPIRPDTADDNQP